MAVTRNMPDERQNMEIGLLLKKKAQPSYYLRTSVVEPEPVGRSGSGSRLLLKKNLTAESLLFIGAGAGASEKITRSQKPEPVKNGPAPQH